MGTIRSPLVSEIRLGVHSSTEGRAKMRNEHRDLDLSARILTATGLKEGIPPFQVLRPQGEALRPGANPLPQSPSLVCIVAYPAGRTALGCVENPRTQLNANHG